MSRLAGNEKKHEFDANGFLGNLGYGSSVLSIGKGHSLFTQGTHSDSAFYIRIGKIKLTVVSKRGREVTIGLIGKDNFVGEGSLSGQPLRMCSATALTDCEVVRISSKVMIAALHRDRPFADMFLAHLLARNIRYEEDLVDQLFNSSEKRLARILLLLAHFGSDGSPDVDIPKISQAALAEMVGTTRSRVSFFMNRFRKLGFVYYNSGVLQIHSSLLNIVLRD